MGAEVLRPTALRKVALREQAMILGTRCSAASASPLQSATNACRWALVSLRRISGPWAHQAIALQIQVTPIGAMAMESSVPVLFQVSRGRSAATWSTPSACEPTRLTTPWKSAYLRISAARPSLTNMDRCETNAHLTSASTIRRRMRPRARRRAQLHMAGGIPERRTALVCAKCTS